MKNFTCSVSIDYQGKYPLDTECIREILEKELKYGYVDYLEGVEVSLCDDSQWV